MLFGSLSSGMRKLCCALREASLACFNLILHRLFSMATSKSCRFFSTEDIGMRSFRRGGYSLSSLRILPAFVDGFNTAIVLLVLQQECSHGTDEAMLGREKETMKDVYSVWGGSGRHPSTSWKEDKAHKGIETHQPPHDLCGLLEASPRLAAGEAKIRRGALEIRAEK
jgi:hypothetical protein